MSSLFADTHNVVAILKKSDAAEGFEQIIDFLSGSYIYYAFTVSPYIYISCIKQFWNSASVKRSGDVTRLQALIDKKKIVISEAIIREILQLNDAEGVNQVGDLSTHTTRFISPALTQKVFANMRRVGKGFSGVETPLFEGMLVARQPTEEGLVAEQVQVDDVVAAAVEETVAKDVAHDTIPSPLPHDIPSPSQEPSLPPLQQQKKDNAAQKLVIIKLKARVKKLEKANMGRMIDDIDMDEGIELVKDADIAKSEGRNAAEHAEKQAEIYNLDLDHSSKVLRKSASTPIDADKPLLKDSDGEDVDVHTYRSMIGSLMYLTSSRLDIMFAKHKVVAASSTEAEYVAAASGCAQVLWIQNQLLDYGYNFMHT
nr:hypothetical protein [Tanacetum cinerariifolium]